MKKICSYIAGLALLGAGAHACADQENALQLEAVQVSAPATRAANNMFNDMANETPGTVETYDAEQIRKTVNATSSAEVVKYLPSLQVRERYIGDRNGIISSRTAGTTSSAQTMMYADGVLLSNLLGNNYSFPPRWGMVSAKEIDHVDVMYGPFSALYAGNSMGGVVNIITRMPDRFEAHASAQGFQQNFKLYGTDEHLWGNHLNASVGNRIGDFSFWIGADHLENAGQPTDFVVRDASTTPGGAAAVTGAYRDLGEKRQQRVVFGAISKDDSRQDNAKIKLAYDISPTLQAAYTLGVWEHDGRSDVESYIRDAAGNPVYNGLVNFEGSNYNVSGFNPGKSEAFHVMQALDIRSDTKGWFDWQATYSSYDYNKDKSSSAQGGADPYVNRAGRISDMSGTGWRTLDLRGIVRPEDHKIDVGYHVDQYTLRSNTSNTADWRSGPRGERNSSSRGDTRTQALYAQDRWQFAPQWALTAGARLEYWEAFNGRNQSTAGGLLRTSKYDEQHKLRLSPKLGLSFEPVPEWKLGAALARAYRFPTVSELFQAITSGSTLVDNNPNLKPEKVDSGELSAERMFSNGLLRATLFLEHKYDALISQNRSFNEPVPFGNGICAATTCGFIENVEHIRTRGVELSGQWMDVGVSGLDIMGSLTLTDAKTLRNAGAPDTVGKRPVRIPASVAKAVFTYHAGERWTHSLAMRYSGRQHSSMSNNDVKQNTYIAASRYFYVDLRSSYRFADRWTASLGVDNLNNYQAYTRHPYSQRTAFAELEFDY